MPAVVERGYHPQSVEITKQKKKIVAYELDHDTQKYAELRMLKFSNPDLYSERKKGLDGQTIFNLETAVGERLNAALSRRTDSVINGLICDKNTGEPLGAMYKKGRDYRKEHGSSEHDQKREAAEVVGFEKIQKVLLDENTPDGTMMLSISPPGEKDSIYKHNFYDVFTKKKNANGEIEIDARRYSSGLDGEAYGKKAEEINSDYFLEPEAFRDPKDVYFLSNPIKIEPAKSKYKSPDDIHRDFHRTHEALSEREFKEVLRVIKPFVHAYIEVLANNPYARDERDLTYDAILNKADEVVDALKSRNKQDYEEKYSDDKVNTVRRSDIIFMGRKPVREVDTGCGLSGGASSSRGGETGAFSVVQFGGSLNKDRYGERTFKCPSCAKMNTRPENELLSHCQHCGSSEVSC